MKHIIAQLKKIADELGELQLVEESDIIGEIGLDLQNYQTQNSDAAAELVEQVDHMVYSEPAMMFWRGAVETLLDNGLSQKQIIELLDSKIPRKSLEQPFDQKVYNLGNEFGQILLKNTL